MNGPARAPGAAWVESPFQLLGALEAAAHGLLGADVQISPRQDTPGIAAAAGAARALHLPLGVRVLNPTAELPALGERRASWATGDVLSGRVQAALVRPLRAEQLVLLDDGLATLHALEQLGAPHRTALTRPRGRTPLPRRALGFLTRERLRHLAGEGRLTVFTVLPVPEPLADRLAGVGVHLVRHRFEWLAQQPGPARISASTVVVGSALPHDGLVDPAPYLRWVESLAEREPLTYLPHRRAHREVLHRLEINPRVRVDRGELPVEVRLLRLGPGQRVLSLPSTALATLRVLLEGSGASVVGKPVPLPWWTDAASPALRAHLESVLSAEHLA